MISKVCHLSYHLLSHLQYCSGDGQETHFTLFSPSLLILSRHCVKISSIFSSCSRTVDGIFSQIDATIISPTSSVFPRFQANPSDFTNSFLICIHKNLRYFSLAGTVDYLMIYITTTIKWLSIFTIARVFESFLQSNLWLGTTPVQPRDTLVGSAIAKIASIATKTMFCLRKVNENTIRLKLSFLQFPAPAKPQCPFSLFNVIFIIFGPGIYYEDRGFCITDIGLVRFLEEFLTGKLSRSSNICVLLTLYFIWRVIRIWERWELTPEGTLRRRMSHSEKAKKTFTLH